MSSLLLIEVGSGIFSYEPTSDRFVKLSQFAHRCRFPYNLTIPPTRSVIKFYKRKANSKDKLTVNGSNAVTDER